MRIATISLMIAAVVFAAAASLVGVKVLAERRAQQVKLEALSAAERAAREELEGRLDRLQGQIAEISGRIARLDVPEGSRSGPAAEPRGDSAEPSPGDEEPQESSARASLAAVIGEAESARLHAFVEEVISEERTRRNEREQLEAMERRKEWEELAKGPYGKFNRRVNTMGKRLGMTAAQMQGYHDLLQVYHARFAELRKTANRSDEESRRQYEETKQQMQSEFDGLVVQRVLNGSQGEAYQELPPHEKNAGHAEDEGAPFVISLGTGGEAMGEITTIRSTVPLPPDVLHLPGFPGQAPVEGTVDVSAPPPPAPKALSR